MQQVDHFGYGSSYHHLFDHGDARVQACLCATANAAVAKVASHTARTTSRSCAALHGTVGYRIRLELKLLAGGSTRNRK